MLDAGDGESLKRIPQRIAAGAADQGTAKLLNLRHTSSFFYMSAGNLTTPPVSVGGKRKKIKGSAKKQRNGNHKRNDEADKFYFSY